MRRRCRRRRASPTTRSAQSMREGPAPHAAERGTDLTIFSPRASGMAHHEADADANARLVGDVQHPDPPRLHACSRGTSSACASLPQAPGVAPANCIPELERCVRELGFVGCNLNPDPSGGYWTDPPLTDRWWYPLYEKMVELDVPAMVHVSSSCNPNFHATGAHYINGDTTAFMQFLTADLFRDFPTLPLHHPAWRRGGAVSLGPLSRARAGHGQAAAHRIPARQRVLRYLRLSPARHGAAGQGDPDATTSCSPRR